MTTKLRRVRASDGAEALLAALKADGGVVVQGFLTGGQVDDINREMQPAMERIRAGSRLASDELRGFHGERTKRLTNMVTHSKTFRSAVLERDLVHDVCEATFAADSGTYWMNTAQAIEIGPGSAAQGLHRDQWQYPVFSACGRDGPEAVVNFIIALTAFREDNGATRVVAGSHRWADFGQTGSEAEAEAAEMEAGDALLISGKVVHGGGANRTADERRRGLAVSFQCSYITPEEAYPFLVSRAVAEALSPRGQRMIGFRCQFPRGSPGLWKCDYAETDEALHGGDAAARG